MWKSHVDRVLSVCVCGSRTWEGSVTRPWTHHVVRWTRGLPTRNNGQYRWQRTGGLEGSPHKTKRSFPLVETGARWAVYRDGRRPDVCGRSYTTLRVRTPPPLRGDGSSRGGVYERRTGRHRISRGLRSISEGSMSHTKKDNLKGTSLVTCRR